MKKLKSLKENNMKKIITTDTQRTLQRIQMERGLNRKKTNEWVVDYIADTRENVRSSSAIHGNDANVS